MIRFSRTFHMVAALGLLGMGLGGCSAFVKSAMLDAPNSHCTFEGETNTLEPGPEMWGIDHEMHVAVGPPEAVLRVWIKHPEAADDGAAIDEPRGTVMVLHGWRNESFWMRHVGDDFTAAGYRVVMVDLRGHGGSTGDTISFGARESRDLTQVVDALEDHDLLAGRVGIWGISMGGATAIQTAAREPRIDAVVSVAPYTSMRAITPLVARRLLPGLNFTSDDEINAMVEEGAAEHGFDPDEADTLAAIRKVEAPVLILHGKGDFIVPVEHGRELRDAADGNVELVELDWTGHLGAHFNSDVATHSLNFLNRHLSPSRSADH